jgi:sulfonate transport system permease protein
MIRNIPHLVLIPLVIRWFGIGEPGKLFLIILGVFFPIYLNTLHGIRSTDTKLLEMGKIYGLGPWRMFAASSCPARCRRFWSDCVTPWGSCGLP